MTTTAQRNTKYHKTHVNFRFTQELEDSVNEVADIMFAGNFSAALRWIVLQGLDTADVQNILAKSRQKTLAIQS